MNKNMLTAAIGLTVLFIIGYFYYSYTVKENTTGENRYRLANKYLEDAEYDKALKIFDEVLTSFPDYKEAHLGKALTLLQMEQFDKSRESFDRAISLDNNYAQAFADRGILNDRTGKYKEAVSDYKKAIELDPEVAEGPGWIWRFLHNVAKAPPTIADRTAYIEQEMKKPADQRLLRIPEIDSQQQMYKK